MPSEAATFDRLHGLSTNSEEPHSIFTDRDPATSIKGCGFKNRSTALQTLLLIEQPGSRYKQYWTVRAMLERAKRHPAAVANSASCSKSDMLEAIRVFEEWLRDRADREKEVATADAHNLDSKRFEAREMAQRRRFASNSILNRHGGTAEEERLHGVEMQKRLQQDQAAGRKALQQGVIQLSTLTSEPCRATSSSPRSETLQSENLNWFTLSGPAFSAVFGGPGLHGYGALREIQVDSDIDENTDTIQKVLVSVRATEQANLMADSKPSQAPTPTWLSNLQSAVGLTKHAQAEREIALKGTSTDLPLADPGGIASLNLGKAFQDFNSFELEYDVPKEKARFVHWTMRMKSTNKQVGKAKNPSQPSVRDFFGKGNGNKTWKRPADSEDIVSGKEISILDDSNRGKRIRHISEGSVDSMVEDTVIVLSEAED